MSDRWCERTEEVLAAERRGILGDALREHALRCPACADALMVEALLGAESEAALAEAGSRLPDAGLAWNRARLAERRRKVERATLPIRLVQTVAWALGAVAAAVGAWQALPVVGRWTGHLLELVAWRPVHPAAHGETGLAAAVGILLVAVLFGVYSEWAEG